MFRGIVRRGSVLGNVRGASGDVSNLGQDYMFLRAAVMSCATLAYRQTVGNNIGSAS